MFSFGYLRASIVYDYIAFWPISFLPLAIHFIAVQNDKRLYGLKFYSLIFSLFVFVFFPFLHLFKASFLPTYSIATEVNRLNQIKEKDLIFSLDTQGAVLLTSITGKGYVLDIINRPGTIGFPESIEVEIIEPKQILIREVNVDSLLKVAGWEVKLGDQNLWNINIFSLGSILNFQNINLNNVSLSGTGEIYLDETHEFNDFVLNGDFTEEAILLKANIRKAEAAIILPDYRQKNDQRTILATLGIKHLSSDCKTIVYANDKESIRYLKRANADEIIVDDDFETFMAAAHILSPGIPEVLNQILDYSSPHSFRGIHVPKEYIGKTYDEFFNARVSTVPLGRFAKPEEIGDLVSFLSSKKSSFINGTTIIIDGGQSRSIS